MNGYVTGKIIVEVLKRCGDDLTRENLMKQATSVRMYTCLSSLPGSILIFRGTIEWHGDRRVSQNSMARDGSL